LHGETRQEYTGVGQSDIIPLLKDEIRLQFMRWRPDLLWMHAGAVYGENGALILAAPSGQGKSTLTTHLTERGWLFLSDDVAPLRMTSNTVIPFPQTPVRRLSGSHEVGADQIALLARETVDIRSEAVCKGERPIACIGFLEYRAGVRPVLERLGRGDAALQLLKNATNFFDHRGAAVERAVDLVSTFPMFRLAYGDGVVAAELVDTELARN
jgi:hypothetical protein